MRRREFQKLGQELCCNFPTDSCKFPTEKIIGARSIKSNCFLLRSSSTFVWAIIRRLLSYTILTDHGINKTSVADSKYGETSFIVFLSVAFFFEPSALSLDFAVVTAVAIKIYYSRLLYNCIAAYRPITCIRSSAKLVLSDRSSRWLTSG